MEQEPLLALAFIHSIMSKTRHLLIGGAGVVGSVYGYHLSRNPSNQVTVYVRPSRAAMMGSSPKIKLYDIGDFFLRRTRWWLVVATFLFLLGLLNLRLPWYRSALITGLTLMVLYRAGIMVVSGAPERTFQGFEVGLLLPPCGLPLFGFVCFLVCLFVFGWGEEYGL